MAGNTDLSAYNDWSASVQATKLTAAEKADKWINRWNAAGRVYDAWAHRFKVPVLYSYYEGFQHLIEQDENNRAYVINLIYSTIEEKLPNLIFDDPVFTLRPHPYGSEFDLDQAIPLTQTKEDALNYICRRKSFGLADKHELAVLDAFFGYGVIETRYSKDKIYNPNISDSKDDPLDNLYCKQIPFDTFRVSASANWDLSVGKWWGYYEFVPYTQLEKYIRNGKIKSPDIDGDTEYADFASLPLVDGKVIVGEANDLGQTPYGTIKILFIEDFERGERLTICPDNAEGGDRLLDIEDFEDSGINVLRYGKRRRGWYPLPPAYNWLDPQDEINDIHQAMRIHRKRFTRKYGIMENSMDPDEKDKFLYGPDGTVITFKRPVNEALQVIQTGPLDTANDESLKISYSDFDRVSGGDSDLTPEPDRQTATASGISAQRSAVRASKIVTRVGDFLCGFAASTLRALRDCPKSFWIEQRIPEGLLTELKVQNTKWTQVKGSLFEIEDYDVDIQVSSISPIYQQEDKKIFLEFLAVLSQYEVLSLSPSLIREAAYRIGYKNSSVLNEFQQMAQLAMVGKIAQAKGQVAALTQGKTQQPQSGPQPGQLQQAQTAMSTPQTMENLRNMLFGMQGSPGQSGGVQQ